MDDIFFVFLRDLRGSIFSATFAESDQYFLSANVPSAVMPLPAAVKVPPMRVPDLVTVPLRVAGLSCSATDSAWRTARTSWTRSTAAPWAAHHKQAAMVPPGRRGNAFPVGRVRDRVERLDRPSRAR